MFSQENNLYNVVLICLCQHCTRKLPLHCRPTAHEQLQAPRKKEYTRANQASFVTKEINKEIMTRSRLINKFLRCRSDENKKAYNEQRNRCVKLVRSAKKAYYGNLSIKDVNDNKNFWKIVKTPFL